jgi:hypothetical protein
MSVEGRQPTDDRGHHCFGESQLARHDLVITRAGTEDFMDVLRGVSLSGEKTTQPRRQVLVDQKSHADGPSTRWYTLSARAAE